MAHVTNNLAGYLEGSLTPEVSARVERHLSDCPRCRVALAELRAAGLALTEAGRSVPVPAADGALWERVRAEISPAAPRRVFLPRWALAGGTAVAAAALAVMVTMRPAPPASPKPGPMVARVPEPTAPERRIAPPVPSLMEDLPAMEAPPAPGHAFPLTAGGMPVSEHDVPMAPSRTPAPTEPRPSLAQSAAPPVALLASPREPVGSASAPYTAQEMPAMAKQKDTPLYAYSDAPPAGTVGGAVPAPHSPDLAFAAPMQDARDATVGHPTASATSEQKARVTQRALRPPVLDDAFQRPEAPASAAASEAAPHDLGLAGGGGAAQRRFARAQSARAMGRKEAASREYTAALEAGLPPTSARLAHIALAEMARESGDNRTALNHYTAALKIARDADLLARIGDIHEQLRNFDEAETAYREALTLSPTSRTARAGLERLKRRGR